MIGRVLFLAVTQYRDVITDRVVSTDRGYHGSNVFLMKGNVMPKLLIICFCYWAWGVGILQVVTMSRELSVNFYL